VIDVVKEFQGYNDELFDEGKKNKAIPVTGHENP
jgi:hypothetical protein